MSRRATMSDCQEGKASTSGIDGRQLGFGATALEGPCTGNYRKIPALASASLHPADRARERRHPLSCRCGPVHIFAALWVRTWLHGQVNYVTVETTDGKRYAAFFDLRRFKKVGPHGIHLMVQSAYILDPDKPAPGKGRIHFHALLGHVLRGTRPRRPAW